LSAADDIDSALELARSGRSDRAEELCRAILASADATPETKNAVKLVRAEVQLAQAEIENELDAFQRLIDDSTDLLRSFLESKPSRSLALQARRGIDWRLHRKAERAAQSLRSTATGKQKTELLRRAVELFESLGSHYRERIRELGQVKDPDEEEISEVTLDSARALLDLARLPGIDDESRKRALREAVDALEDIQFESFDSVVAFEALRVEGQCHGETGDLAAAQDRFLGAAELYRRLREANRKPDGIHRAIAGGALLNLGEILVRAGQPKEALAVADRAYRDDSELEGDSMGWAFKLLKAEALFQVGDLGLAHELATQVIRSDPHGALAAAAKQKLRLWSAEADSGPASGEPASPERLLLKAASLAEGQEWDAALAALRSCLEATTSDEARRRHHPEALYRMVQCFAQKGRRHEAVSTAQKLLADFPQSDLAPRACFEAARALSSELAVSGNERDEKLKDELLERLVREWPEHPAAKNVAFLQAEKLERARAWSEAAELYLKVPEDAEAYENALVAAARSRYAAASTAWEASRSDTEREPLRRDFLAVRETLDRFFARANNPELAPKSFDRLRQRAQLNFVAVQHLAVLFSHESVAQYAEALQVLESFAGSLAAGDPKLARVWGLKLRPLLALKRVSDAVTTLDIMLDRYPRSPATIQGCRTVAVHLEESTHAELRGGADSGEVAEDLKRMQRYYATWVRGSFAAGARVTAADAVSVARTLLATARKLHGLDDGALSFLDLAGVKVIYPSGFQDAAFVFGLLADGKLGALEPKVRLEVMASAARAEGFVAASTETWERVRDRYLAIVGSQKLLDSSEKLNAAALRSKPAAPILVSTYIELGAAHSELAMLGQAPEFEKAFGIFQNVLAATEGGSAPWWTAKYLSLATLVDRGSPSDVRLASIILENLEKNFPDFDGGKFRWKERILALKERLSRLKAAGG
jgi:tetratricopeptide (TPR) repeat protein